MHIQSEYMATHSTIMRHLADQHRMIVPLIHGRPVHYLDIPAYENVGDLLIYLGTLRFLHDNNCDPLLVRPCFGYSPHQPKGAVIVLQGGGNLGDIYPAHQRFRERLISTYRHNRIVILPQTIFFRQPLAFDRARKIFNAHPDLHLFVRDKPSLVLAKKLTDKAAMLPDMAHQLYPIRTTGNHPSCGPLRLYRTDQESARNHWAGHGQEDRQSPIDWPDIAPKSKILMRKLFALPAKVGVPFANDYFMWWWEATARVLVNKAIDLFSRHDSVITDRLHAHILASLMNIPSTVIDNSYGKNQHYVRAWTMESPITRLQTGG